jgi:hypothetical protein
VFFIVTRIITCSPFETNQGGKGFKNPYAIRFDKIEHLVKVIYQRSEDRKTALGRSDKPRSWQAIKNSFNAIPGNTSVGRSPTMQSPVKKKSKESVVIDLTLGEGGSGRKDDVRQNLAPAQQQQQQQQQQRHASATPKMEPRPSPPQPTTATGTQRENTYNPNIAYYLGRDVHIRLPTGPTRAMRTKSIRRLPGDFLSDPVRGKRTLELFDQKLRGTFVTILVFPPETSQPTRSLFAKSFSNWMANIYAPKAHSRIDALVAKLPDTFMCHCSTELHRHMALPGFRLDCGHAVCGICLQDSFERIHATPCCEREIRNMPAQLETNRELELRLGEENLHSEYATFYGDPKRKIEKLRGLIENRLRYTGMSNNNNNNRHGAMGNSFPHADGLLVEQHKLLPRPTFIVTEKPTSPSCKECQKKFSSDDSTRAFGIRRDTVCSWYHMGCVDPGIRFRALTQGIEDYNTMDETTKTQILKDMLTTS